MKPPTNERQALMDASDRIEEAQRLHDELRSSRWQPRRTLRPAPPADDDRGAIVVAMLGLLAVVLVSLAAAAALLLPAVLP
jgi:hypothetical protein